LAGAQGGVNYRDTDWDKALLEQCPGGFDLIVDSAGGPDFARLIDAARPGGRVVFFGATQGNVPELPLRKIFWRQIDLRGTTMGSPRDFAAMLKWVNSCKLHPALEPVLPVTETTQAMHRFAAGEAYGKQVLKIEF
jgi:zinc-binding alcohol dehydrogenase/oxidoreductase